MARVLIAPDSFKGSLPAREVAVALAVGWRSVRPGDELRLIPQADGGEGTLDAVEAAVDGAVRVSTGSVTGPDGRPAAGQWLRLPGGVAVVELAQCSGLPLMGQLDAVRATTRGLGEVIRSALQSGATSLVVGLGGSASTDAGAGALSALGLELVDEQGELVADGGRALRNVVAIRRERLVMPGSVTLLTDVTAPLLGPRGAAAVFGPQKGASAGQVGELEAALAHFARLFGGDPTAAGAGAAGGTGYGFATAWGAAVVPGAEYLAELSGLTTAIESADILLTGEGRFDEQSLGGKVVGQLLQRAASAGVTAGVVAGQLAAKPDGWAVSLSELAGEPAAAMAETRRWCEEAGARAARELT